MYSIKVIVETQQLFVYQHDVLVRQYSISTAKNGVGEVYGSEQTPRGLHVIRAKIGAGLAPNAVFNRRRPTGELYTPALREQNPARDWILGRILWLSGLDVGKNRLGSCDTMRRFVYIHGTPDEVPMGIPGSKGCIRMRNSDLVELFDFIPVYTQVLIQEKLD